MCCCVAGIVILISNFGGQWSAPATESALAIDADQ